MESPSFLYCEKGSKRRFTENPLSQDPFIQENGDTEQMKSDSHSKKYRQASMTFNPAYDPLPEEVEIEFEDDGEEPEGCSMFVNKVQEKLSKSWSLHVRKIKCCFIVLCVIGYLVYFVAALMHNLGDEGSIRLIGITTVVALLKFIPTVRGFVEERITVFIKPVREFLIKYSSKINLIVLCGIYMAVLIVIAVDLVVYSTDAYNLVSLSGMIVYILLMFIFSLKPSKVKWKVVIWGFGLQFAFSLVILRWPAGYSMFKWLGDRVYDIIGFLNTGCLFLFGPSYKDHFFAMQVLPFVIFISSLITILFYFGTMEWIICKLAWVMQTSMGTTAGESVSAAGNIFIGQTESPLLVRPILHCMTESEVHAMMTCGFATIAGGTLAAYILFGVPSNHLLSASVMSAPAALAVAKLSYPETKKSLTTAMDVKQLIHKSPEKSFIEAAASGASFAIPLVANIAANLIAFISILEGLNAALIWFGDRVGSDQPITFQLVCSYALWPFALVMGVPVEDCRKVAQLIGIKTFINEFVAYESLSQLIANRKLFDDHITNNGSYSWFRDDVILNHLSGNTTKLTNGIIGDRSVVISTYALCGFSNIGSIGVQIGAFSAIVPSRRSVFSKLALRAMIAGNVACFLTACVAGLFYSPMPR